MTNGQPHPDDLLSAHHDSELSVDEQAAVERLLDQSPDARAELEDYRALTDLLRELPSGRAPDGFRTAVMRRIERESLLAAPPKPVRPVRGSFRSSWLVIGGSLGAAAALLFAVGQFDRGPARDRRIAQGDAPPMADAPSVESLARLGRAENDVERFSAAPSRESLPLLKADGGETLAGAEAKPPVGFKVGDMYAYLEQTADGDILVVQATVIDVRKALNQIQVLFTRNSIPTIQVSTAVDDQVEATTSSNDDLVLYIESEPPQMNAALAELNDNQNLFVQVEYAGVLDPTAGATLSYQSLDRLEQLRDVEAPLDIAAQSVRSGGLGGSMRPQARASVADARFGELPASPVEASRPIAPLMVLGSSVPEQAASEPDSLAAKDMELAQKKAAATEYSNGYQTVLNVPRGELLQQLNAPKPPAESKELADEARASSDFFYSRGLERRPLERRLEDEDVRLTESENRQLGMRSLQTTQRRLRLLVVLEPQMAGAKAMKAKAAMPAGPVEAPVPAPRKG